MCKECEFGYPAPLIFFTPFSKILISKDLLQLGWSESAQNPEPQGLIAKIFQNKELAIVTSRLFFSSSVKILIRHGLRIGDWIRDG